MINYEAMVQGVRRPRPFESANTQMKGTIEICIEIEQCLQ